MQNQHYLTYRMPVVKPYIMPVVKPYRMTVVKPYTVPACTVHGWNSYN